MGSDNALSRKRKGSAEEAEVSDDKLGNEEDAGKRRDKHRHKHHHHRKHKHRGHKKHKADPEEGAATLGTVQETEDGEILEAGQCEVEEGQIPSSKDGSFDKKAQSPRRSTSRPRDDYMSRHGDGRHRSCSRPREEDRHKPVSRDEYAFRQSERKRHRSRSRDHRGGDRFGRNYPYSPERRRRSRSRDRERYVRERGSYRDRDREDRDREDRDRDREDRDRDREDRRRGTRDSEEPQAAKKSEEARDKEDQEEYLERVEHQLAEQEEDVEKVKEESRRRRQAILEKYKKENETTENNIAKQDVVADEIPRSFPPVSEAVVEEKVKEEKENGLCSMVIDGPEPRHDEDAPEAPATEPQLLAGNARPALGEGTPPKNERGDMFCDIFGESPPVAMKTLTSKPDGIAVETSGLTDNWDDADGYYTYRVGEVFDGRYEVAASHGRGVFSTVVRAKDTKPGKGDPEEVAIKIIRNNETMYKAGQRELIILRKLAGADPDNRRHCVRLLSSFEYRNHLCLVFESLHMNLREILKKFGRNIGISLKAVRAYALQLFTALKHLRNCGVLHCDIKPDNMLVNEAKNVLKLCDFGSAMFAGENEITPYLVSRFYRAPEIILGLPYDHALDMWSVGCCLYELYTGKVLFPGYTNNDMLRLHMELKGPFPKKMLKKALTCSDEQMEASFVYQHFDQDYNFFAIEEDSVTKKTMRRMINVMKPREFSTLIRGNADEDPKMLTNFKHLLEKMFVLDPEKRLTVSQALNHPFILGK